MGVGLTARYPSQRVDVHKAGRAVMTSTHGPSDWCIHPHEDWLGCNSSSAAVRGNGGHPRNTVACICI